MGLFYEKPALSDVAITGALRDALKQPPELIDVDTEAARRADELQAGGGGEFQTVRFLIAVAILVAFVTAAVWTDAVGVDDSSKALYGFATTIMGVIVGLLAGEKSTS